ncbi:MAG: class I SAM-dependent methyltransferase [Rubrivivax sp.]
MIPMATHSFLDGMQFLRRFIDNPREVGALWPSSSRLAKEMVRDLALHPGDLVIEYGAGTGALTSAIAARLAMTPGARYLGIEQDGEFCDRLRQRFPRLDFVRDRVENVQALRRERGLPAPRAILSGLPVVLMPTLRDVVLEAERSLRPGGEFRQFSYLLSWPTPRAFELRRLMRETFAVSSCSALVLCNLPPAWVLKGRKALVGEATVRRSGSCP